VFLALESGIAPSVWAQEGEQAIVTALELLKGDKGKSGRHVVASG
jgi:hypothetical protein